MTILFIDYAINSLNFYLNFAFKSLVKKLDFVGFAPKPPPGAPWIREPLEPTVDLAVNVASSGAVW